MTISQSERHQLSTAIDKHGAEWGATPSDYTRFHNWYIKTVDYRSDDPVELPVEFQTLYRKLLKLKEYDPDSDALLLQAERANPSPFTPSTKGATDMSGPKSSP